VDLSRIAFGRADADGVQVTIDCDLDFDFEGGGFKNRAARIACRGAGIVPIASSAEADRTHRH
jgi:hypothetical protein